MRPLVLALGMVLVLACGGATPTGTPGAAAPAAGASAPTAAAAATSAPTSAPAAAAQAGTKPPTFAELVGAAKAATYKVTYRWSGTSEGESVAAEQTWYVKGSQSRFDFTMKEGRLSVFDLTDGSYMCVATGDAYYPEWSCLGGPKDNALKGNQGATFSLEVEDRPDRFDPTYEGTRSIAGQTAQCFALKDKTGASDFGDGRICYSGTGIPLFLQSKGSGFDMTFEATVFSTTVTDADLKLPATPIKYGAP